MLLNFGTESSVGTMLSVHTERAEACCPVESKIIAAAAVVVVVFHALPLSRSSRAAATCSFVVLPMTREAGGLGIIRRTSTSLKRHDPNDIRLPMG